MTARTSMTSLITTLRGFTNSGTADFSDDTLQQVLDRYKTDLRDVLLSPYAVTVSPGVAEYKDYQAPIGWFESTDSGGSARFVVGNGLGTVFGTALWSADYENGLVSFVNDQAGSARYLTAHSYDVYAAASDVWQQKAAQAATAIDFSTDNHSIKRSHIIAACMTMANKYAGMATTGGASSVDVVRGDKGRTNYRWTERDE